MVDFPETYRKLWYDWDIRAFVLCSMCLQIFLIFSSPHRKRTSSKLFTSLVWSAYLLADWVAAFALGLLSDLKDDSGGRPNGKTTNTSNRDIYALWAPILLLHLGGPDTITAFALEDNELWPRHLIALLFEFGAAFYVFARTLPHNKLLVPTILMFIAGLIKYVERTCSLYLASMAGFRNSMLTPPDPGPNYAKLMDEYTSKLEAGIPAKIEMIKEPENPDKAEEEFYPDSGMDADLDPVCAAHRFFGTFKRMIVDLIFSFHERNESRKFFLKESIDYTYTFEVIEIELSFLYHVLFTKATVVHTHWGYFFRAVCSYSILGALLFFLFHKKNGFHETDIAITYALLIVAMTLDVVALGMLIFSEWTTVFIKNSRFSSCMTSIFNNIKIIQDVSNLVETIRTPRWSATMPQFNLIAYCLYDHETIFEKVFRFFCVKEMLDEWRYATCPPVSEKLKEFLHKELKKKSQIAKNSKETERLCLCRGDWALEQRGYLHEFGDSIKVEFDESLLMWHIATDICYYMEENNDKVPKIESDKVPKIESDKPRDWSKFISDYLLYLLVMRPTMMSSMAGIGQIRYLDTCAEAINFFIQRENQNQKTKLISNECVWPMIKKRDPINTHRQTKACTYLHDVNTEAAEPKAVKGDQSKSVLFDACILAKRLNKLEKARRWEIISEVWAEMLAYAASHCRGNAHAQQLSKGGELLTFIWFLMAHLGLGEQYRIESGHARAKLIVNK